MLSDGQRTVADYFDDRYGKLKYPHFPCVEVHSLRQCYFPVEKCVVRPGQKCDHTLEENAANTLKNKGILKPSDKFQLTGEALKNVIEKPEYTEAFKISLATKPVTFDAKVLETPPAISDILEMPLEGNPVVKWTIVDTCPDNHFEKGKVENFSQQLKAKGEALRIYVSPRNVKKHLPSQSSIDEMLSDEIKYAGADILVIFIILDVKNSPIYNSIKRVAETQIGVITQCVAAASVCSKYTDQIATNIMRKVRAKMGCTNVKIPAVVNGFDLEDVMVVGADVTHPGPTENNTPSVAAVVASVDKLAARYVAAFRIQKKNEARARIEIIQEMKHIAEYLLRAYKTRNGSLPGKILFYRDGVGEGQFSEVCRNEVGMLKAACDKLREGYAPLITFVSVQKRHRTRIIASSPGSPNVPPGTVVDTTITHPLDFDFFLCPHTPKAGSTARLAHYYVLHDDNKFPAETLQTITLCLCKAYVRCASPVSIPAPVYYAHHATKRALCYLRAAHGGEATPSTAQLDDAIKLQDEVKSKMFFV